MQLKICYYRISLLKFNSILKFNLILKFYFEMYNAKHIYQNNYIIVNLMACSIHTLVIRKFQKIKFLFLSKFESIKFKCWYFLKNYQNLNLMLSNLDKNINWYQYFANLQWFIPTWSNCSIFWHWHQFVNIQFFCQKFWLAKIIFLCLFNSIFFQTYLYSCFLLTFLGFYWLTDKNWKIANAFITY